MTSAVKTQDEQLRLLTERNIASVFMKLLGDIAGSADACHPDTSFPCLL
jgi:hypothetical protein